jgi:hypothetical protein
MVDVPDASKEVAMASDLRLSAVLVLSYVAADEPDWDGDWIDLGGEG